MDGDDWEREWECESDSAGGYRLVGALVGKGRLRCWQSGWDQVLRDVVLSEDVREFQEDFVLHRPAGVPLRITTRDGGNPLAGVPRRWRVRITAGKLPAQVKSLEEYEPKAGHFVQFRPPRDDRDRVPVEGVIKLEEATGYVHVTIGSSVIASRPVQRTTKEVLIVLPEEVLDRYLASLSVRYVCANGEESEPFGASLRPPGGGTHSMQLGPDSTRRAENLPPGRYTLVITVRGEAVVVRTVLLGPGQDLDLGDVRSLAIEGQVVGPDGRSGAYSLIYLGRFLPEHGVVDWSAGTSTKADSSGGFAFAMLAPGRYVVRCDRNTDPLSVANFPDLGSDSVWVNLGDHDLDRVEITLRPTVEVVVPARTSSSRTRSLRIHDASGHELRSEWVLEEPYSLYLVSGTYEVAWWSDQEELKRVQFVVQESRIELKACP